MILRRTRDETTRRIQARSPGCYVRAIVSFVSVLARQAGRHLWSGSWLNTSLEPLDPRKRFGRSLQVIAPLATCDEFVDRAVDTVLNDEELGCGDKIGCSTPLRVRGRTVPHT